MMIQFVKTDLFSVAISHNRYTLLNQEAVPLWEVCQQHGVAAVNAAPYGSGILAKGPAIYPRYMYNSAPDTYLHRAFAVEAHCQHYGVSLAAAALQFSLRDPRIASTIVGISKPERLQETLRLAQQPIPEQLWEDIAEVS
jgi:D-threo-aldose 1-dehydrogenase